MKKMIAMLVMGGALAICTIGCGPASTTENKTNVTADKTKVDVKDKKADVKVEDKNVDVKTKEKDAPK